MRDAVDTTSVDTIPPNPWVRLCCKEWMHGAVDTIPPQSDSWSCGINSAAKGIYMFGHHMSKAEYKDKFLPNAPKSISKEKITRTGDRMMVGGTAAFCAGVLLVPFTGGASLAVALPAWGTSVVGFGVSVTGGEISSDVGPRPKRLAKYIADYLPGNRKAEYESYNDFWTCAKYIRDNLRGGKPVIVFWAFSATKAHYINVVGVLIDENDRPEEFVVMDTDNCLYKLSWQDMQRFMKREFASYALTATTFNNYHLVRFYR